MARNGNFEILNFTGLVEVAPRTPRLMSQLGLVTNTVFGESTIAQVERITDYTNTINAQPRGGERNFAGRENAIVRNFNIPLFPLDTKVTASQVQDLRKYGTSDTPATVEDRVMRIMSNFQRDYATLKEKAIYAAIKGDSYSPGWTQGQYNYATEFGVTGSVITADVNFATVDLPSSIAETARAHIIDNAGDDASAYRIIALCGRAYFTAFIESDEIVEAYGGYPSAEEPLRRRVGGDLINRSFIHKGVTYIEDISGEIDTDDAYYIPLGITNMFQTVHAPADTIEEAQKTAKEMYVWLLNDNHRVQTVESETSFIVVNTRPELVVKSSATYTE